MPIKKVILHAGAHKTGTTTVQQVLFQNRVNLREAGVLYPKLTLSGKPVSNHSLVFDNLFTVSPERNHHHIMHGLDTAEKVESQKKITIKEIESQIKKFSGNTLLFSAESISSIKYNEQALHRIRSFFTEITNHDVDLSILMSIRNPYKFYPSIIQQQLKGGLSVSLSYKKWLDLCCDYFQNIILRSERIFGKDQVKIVRFEDSIKSEVGLVGTILMYAGLPKRFVTQPAFTRITRSNPSMSQEASWILSNINEDIPKIVGSTANPERKKFKIRRVLEIPGQRFQLPPERLKLIVEKSKEDLDWVCSRYELKKYTVGNADFTSADSATNGYWSAKTLRYIVARLLFFPPRVRESIQRTLHQHSKPSSIKWVASLFLSKGIMMIAPIYDYFFWINGPVRNWIRATIKPWTTSEVHS